MKYTREEIKGLWHDFLSQTEYGRKLLDVIYSYPDTKSLIVKFRDIDNYDDDFAEDLLQYPEIYLEIGERALREYGETNYHVHLRISEIPERDRVKEIRKLRTVHLGKFVSIEGIIRRASEIRPRLKVGAFQCSDCGQITMEEQEGARLKEPDKCDSCGKPRGKVKFKLVIGESVFEDYQSIEIQDMPENLRGGEQPQRIDANLKDDLAAMVVPGDRVILNGILRAREIRIQNTRSTEFKMYLDVNSIDQMQEGYEDTDTFTDEEIEAINELATSGDVIEKLKDSIAPTIYGMDIIKEALVLQMFGGVAKKMPDGTKIRGDIHVLLVGDPGTAKSQLLQRMSEMAPRGIYTSGKGSSAAGLTATAVKDDTGRWTLEAGALVLADQGLAAIDEIDKMSTTDRDSIYQAMEQQIISVTKAGIYATLMSRCSILAAANPKYGRFDPDENIASQIDLPIPLLSRFDVIFKILDIPNEKRDRDMADYILNVHLVGEKIMLGEEDAVVKRHVQKVPPELVKKYVSYAKRNIIPKLSDDALNEIENEYLRIRNKFKETHSVAITPRQLEAMIRLSEASARARLSDVVTREDALRAIKIVKFFLKDVASSGGITDIDVISAGMSKSERDKIKIIKSIIRELIEEMGGAKNRDILMRAKEEGITDDDEVRRLVEKIATKGEIYYDRQRGWLLT